MCGKVGVLITALFVRGAEMTNPDFFYVRALYDTENDLYYSDSNIDGLHLEADTLKEFWKEAYIWSVDLLQENHGVTAGKVVLRV